jgi:hypothetical protein
MKSKIYVWSLLSVVGMAVAATPASAFWWLFHKHHGIHRHSTVIVCRPYNAFTPVCSGNIVCDGCCPFNGMAGHMGGGCDHMGGACGMGHDMASLGGPVGGMHLGMPGVAPHPSAYVGAPMPTPGYYPMHGLPVVPNYQPAFQPTYQPNYQPNFQPQQAPIPNTQTYAPMNQGYPVQPANFQQQNPVYYSLYPMHQVPSYWYGN